MLTPVTSSPAQRGSRRRERTRLAVMDAAERLMADDASESFRIEDVAAEAGVSPASIYTHFGTKDALRASVVERLLAMMDSTLQEAYAAPGPPIERLENVGLRFMELLLSHPALSRYLSANDPREPASEAEAQVATRLNRVRQGFEQAIQIAVDAGDMIAIDARLLSYTLLATWTGMAAYRLRRDELHLDATDIEAALLQTIRTFTSGLQAPNHRQAPRTSP